MCDLFYFLEGLAVARYADDATLYSVNKTKNLVIKEIEHFSEVLFKWFDSNYMKINSGKNNRLFSEIYSISANIENHTIMSENKNELLLGTILNPKLSFEDHKNSFCKKANQKLNALARVLHTCVLKKRKTVMKTYISQFGYCPLVWMFHSRCLNNKINSLHETALRITYFEISSSFQDLLKKDNSVLSTIRIYKL